MEKAAKPLEPVLNSPASIFGLFVWNYCLPIPKPGGHFPTDAKSLF
jgi:hypothetical protein